MNGPTEVDEAGLQVRTLLHFYTVCTHRTMLRRQTRERREYIFKKSQESQERAIWERKQRIKELLATGKPIPPELRADVREFGGKDLVLDEAQAGELLYDIHGARSNVGFRAVWAGGHGVMAGGIMLALDLSAPGVTLVSRRRDGPA